MSVVLLVAVLLGAACVVFGLAVREARPLAFAGGVMLVGVVGFFAWLMLSYATGR